jgi:hypothetical protein
VSASPSPRAANPTAPRQSGSPGDLPAIDIATASSQERDRRTQHARSSWASLRAGVGAGALVGLTVGLLFGGILGAIVVWLSGAVIEWQRTLGFTLGVEQTLLPFGDQAGTLRWLSDNSLIVVPVAAGIVGVLAAVLAALVGGIVTAAYNLATNRTGIVEVEPSAGSDEG